MPSVTAKDVMNMAAMQAQGQDPSQFGTMKSGMGQKLPGQPAPAQAAAPGTPPTTLTPDYVDANKKDIANTFQYSPENDYNAKIRAWLGMGQQ